MTSHFAHSVTIDLRKGRTNGQRCDYKYSHRFHFLSVRLSFRVCFLASSRLSLLIVFVFGLILVASFTGEHRVLDQFEGTIQKAHDTGIKVHWSEKLSELDCFSFSFCSSCWQMAAKWLSLECSFNFPLHRMLKWAVLWWAILKAFSSLCKHLRFGLAFLLRFRLCFICAFCFVDPIHYDLMCALCHRFGAYLIDRNEMTFTNVMKVRMPPHFLCPLFVFHRKFHLHFETIKFFCESSAVGVHFDCNDEYEHWTSNGDRPWLQKSEESGGWLREQRSRMLLIRSLFRLLYLMCWIAFHRLTLRMKVVKIWSFQRCVFSWSCFPFAFAQFELTVAILH